VHRGGENDRVRECETIVPGLVSFAGNGAGPAPVLAKSPESPELVLAICDDSSADLGTIFVATRETDFSASLLELSIPDAKSLSPNRG
jgi:hypothetical protein